MYESSCFVCILFFVLMTVFSFFVFAIVLYLFLYIIFLCDLYLLCFLYVCKQMRMLVVCMNNTCVVCVDILFNYKLHTSLS